MGAKVISTLAALGEMDVGGEYDADTDQHGEEFEDHGQSADSDQSARTSHQRLIGMIETVVP